MSRKEEQLKDMPIIKTTVSKSKDGKYVVTRTTFTYIVLAKTIEELQ